MFRLVGSLFLLRNQVKVGKRLASRPQVDDSVSLEHALALSASGKQQEASFLWTDLLYEPRIHCNRTTPERALTSALFGRNTAERFDRPSKVTAKIPPEIRFLGLCLLGDARTKSGQDAAALLAFKDAVGAFEGCRPHGGLDVSSLFDVTLNVGFCQQRLGRMRAAKESFLKASSVATKERTKETTGFVGTSQNSVESISWDDDWRDRELRAVAAAVTVVLRCRGGDSHPHHQELLDPSDVEQCTEMLQNVLSIRLGKSPTSKVFPSRGTVSEVAAGGLLGACQLMLLEKKNNGEDVPGGAESTPNNSDPLQTMIFSQLKEAADVFGGVQQRHPSGTLTDDLIGGGAVVFPWLYDSAQMMLSQKGSQTPPPSLSSLRTAPHNINKKKMMKKLDPETLHFARVAANANMLDLACWGMLDDKASLHDVLMCQRMLHNDHADGHTNDDRSDPLPMEILMKKKQQQTKDGLFWPESFVLPRDASLAAEAERLLTRRSVDKGSSMRNHHPRWVLKAATGWGGHGINFFWTLPSDLLVEPEDDRQSGLPVGQECGDDGVGDSDDDDVNDRSWLLQRYVALPMLIQDRKFSVRIYIVVVGTNIAQCSYLSKKGLVKLAGQKFSDNDEAPLYDDGFVGDEEKEEGGGGTRLNDDDRHVTNSGRYHTRKATAGILKNDKQAESKEREEREEEGEEGEGGSDYEEELDLDFLKYHVASQGGDFTTVWRDIAVASGRCLAKLDSLTLRTTGSNFFLPKILGVDFLLDDFFHPWIIEVNRFPGLAPRSSVDRRVKTAVVEAAWDIAEKTRAAHFTGKAPAVDIPGDAGAVLEKLHVI